MVATDDYTVEYRLKAPYSELLYQLTFSFGIIVDKANVEALGADFGVKGFNGTGPYCWVEWRPRNDLKLKRNPNYKWGPPVYENRGPAHIEEIVWRIVPEETTRLAAVDDRPEPGHAIRALFGPRADPRQPEPAHRRDEGSLLDLFHRLQDRQGWHR